MLLIGGHALRYHVSSMPLNGRLKDYDFICTYEEFDKWAKYNKKDVKECYPIDEGKKMVVKTVDTIYEFEIAWPDSTAKQLIDYCSKDPDCYGLPHTDWPGMDNVGVPSLHVLYTIKMSHRYLRNNPHFLKTMNDIKLMRKFGAMIPDSLTDWYKARQKETYWYKHPNLNQGKMGFFNPNEGVNYVYDHDSIHRAMAQLEMPAYEYYKGDSAEVLCDKKKFFALDEMTRLYGVLEESYVLAIERSQVPFPGKTSPKWSFLKALEKVCTSITSGWFREYAWENYNKVIELYNPNYMDVFNQGIDKGIVKKL